MSDTVSTRAGQAASAAREQAGEVATTAKEQAAAVAGDARDQARAVVADARGQARTLLDDSRQQVRDQAAEQSRRAASSLRDLGDQLHRMAAAEGVGQGPAVDLAQQAADGVQRLADTLQQRRPEELLDDVKRFARQRPGMFVLGALGAGFLAGRLLRSVDTGSLGEAAKAGAGIRREDGLTEPEPVTGPGTLGSLQSGGIPDPLVAPPPSAATMPAAMPESPRWVDDPGLER